MIETTKDNGSECKDLTSRIFELSESFKRQKYNFKHHEKAIDNVNCLFFLDEKSKRNIYDISAKYLLASFSLDYLKLLSKHLEEKYLHHQVTLSHFEDVDKKKQVEKVFNDSKNTPVIQWLRDDCLVTLKDAVDHLIVDDMDDVLNLGNILDLTLDELENEGETRDIELYDVPYRLKCRFQNLNNDYFKTGDKNKILAEYSFEMENTAIFYIGMGDESVPAEKACLKKKDQVKGIKVEFTKKEKRHLKIFQL
ncbi:MAG: hypothetical protein A4E23_01678 [Methanomethylovorans sp. PtaU1.Bin073]|nr:MAG: hypothetical protein A4E23_01678 [Methanomethylovorans sp. PtaU1.Bin073]